MDHPAPQFQEAPGTKASRVCGILAIIFALTCIGIPVGIVLGIVALVQHAKAKRLARQFQENYATPSASAGASPRACAPPAATPFSNWPWRAKAWCACRTS